MIFLILTRIDSKTVPIVSATWTKIKTMPLCIVHSTGLIAYSWSDLEAAITSPDTKIGGRSSSIYKVHIYYTHDYVAFQKLIFMSADYSHKETFLWWDLCYRQEFLNQQIFTIHDYVAFQKPSFFLDQNKYGRLLLGDKKYYII